MFRTYPECTNCNLVKEVVVKAGVKKKHKATYTAGPYLSFSCLGKILGFEHKKEKKEMSDFRKKHIFTENIFKCCFEVNVFA